jgi:hypothetical protein
MKHRSDRNCGLLPRPLLMIATTAALIWPAAVFGADFVQTSLVSDIAGLAAVTDANLKNPWGFSHSPTSPFWASNQVTNTSILYAVTGKTTVVTVPFVVAIPTTSTTKSGLNPAAASRCIDEDVGYCSTLRGIRRWCYGPEPWIENNATVERILLLKC